MKASRTEHGFSLIEVLVALALSLVVIGAAMTLLVVTVHGQDASQKRNDAQDRARLAIDLIARQLRNVASPLSSPKLIERNSSNDLVFQTIASPSGSNSTGAERVRYCIPNDTPSGSASSEVLIGQTQTWTTSTAPSSIPWSTSSCPDTATSDSTANTYTRVVPYVTNRYQQRTDRPAFSYYASDGTTPSDVSQITNVSVDLFVNPTPSVANAEAELKSEVYLRNQLQSPAASFTYTDTGSGGVLLNGGSSYSPDGQYLTYSWSCSGTCPRSSMLTGATDALVDWTPGAGTYSVTLTVTDPTGLTGTYSSSVTVT